MVERLPRTGGRRLGLVRHQPAERPVAHGVPHARQGRRRPLRRAGRFVRAAAHVEIAAHRRRVPGRDAGQDLPARPHPQAADGRPGARFAPEHRHHLLGRRRFGLSEEQSGRKGLPGAHRLLEADEAVIHYERIEGDAGKPVLVFLHEGLGSIRQWRDFPQRVAQATGCPAVIYDRYGYGQSDVLREKRRTVRFMHDEALVSLPNLLGELRIENPILIGHSDGASIALIHAGAGFPVRKVVAMAPHVFIEPICISSIEKAKTTFETTDLPERLGKYHRDPRKTFFGWADVWLDPEFKGWDIRDDYLPGVSAPVLAIQGHDDEYGTMAQLDEIARRVKGPCELLKLDDCGHAPFRDQPDQVLKKITAFVK